jgi:cytochrome P450
MLIIRKCLFSVGWGDAVLVARYGPSHTHQRKLLHDAFEKKALSQYSAIQERETNVLLKGLTNSPRDYEKHVQRYVSSFIDNAVHSFHAQVFWGYNLRH